MTDTWAEGAYLSTFTGRSIDVHTPRLDDVDIQDIAHALSQLCRFGGHCRDFYSVAQHSVIVSEFVPLRMRMSGLLHDAHEAYLGDVVTPVKRKIGMAYYDMADDWDAIIAEKFGLKFLHHALIERADRSALLIERGWILSPGAQTSDSDAGTVRLTPLEPRVARRAFLERFYAYHQAGLR